MIIRLPVTTLNATSPSRTARIARVLIIRLPVTTLNATSPSRRCMAEPGQLPDSVRTRKERTLKPCSQSVSAWLHTFVINMKCTSLLPRTTSLPSGVVCAAYVLIAQGLAAPGRVKGMQTIRTLSSNVKLSQPVRTCVAS